MVIPLEFRKSVDFQINLTNFCPVGCDHCYIDSNKRLDKSHINENDLKEIIKKLIDYIKNKEDLENINVIIIGGEVLYLPKNYLEIVKENLNDLKQQVSKIKNKSISFKLSSSLLIKDLKDYDFFINFFDDYAISWDYNLSRFKNIKLIYLENNIEYLQKNYKEKIISLNITVTKNIIHKIDEIYSLISKYNIKHYHLGFYVPSMDNKLNDVLLPEFEETSNFYIDFYKKFKKDDVFISPVDSSINRLKYNKSNENLVCEMLNLFSIDFNGKVFICPEKRGVSKQQEFSKSILTNNLYDIEKESGYRKERFKVLKFDSNMCLSCEFKKNCYNGCSILKNYYNDKQTDCWGFKKQWLFSKSLLKNE